MLRNRRSKSNRHFYILIGVSVCLNAYLWQTKREANKEHKERDAVLFDDIKFVLQRLKVSMRDFVYYYKTELFNILFVCAYVRRVACGVQLRHLCLSKRNATLSFSRRTPSRPSQTKHPS